MYLGQVYNAKTFSSLTTLDLYKLLIIF